MAEDIIYRGIRTTSGLVQVEVVSSSFRNYHLPPRNDLRNHSPDGFEWGYSGSGPAQLSLALCAHALDDDQRAQMIYHEFKWRVVSSFPEKRWEISKEDVVRTIELLESELLK